MSESIANILLIEDDEEISELVSDSLKRAGYLCQRERDGMSGLKSALGGSFDLVVLDLGLPGLSGLDVCSQIRRANENLPIIMLTANSEEIDIVTGLEKGADDYLTKPFGTKELLARIRVRLRESTRRKIAAANPNNSQSEAGSMLPIRIGELFIDPERMKVTLRGEAIEFSAREFEFLWFLAANAGKPISRDELLQQLWGTDLENYRPNVTVIVSRIRKKIEDDPENPRYLLTMHGVGYRFAEDSELNPGSSRRHEPDSE